MNEPKKERCKNGQRRDPKTGKCIDMTEDVLKHKQALRNKKKGVNVDETGKKIKPTRFVNTSRKTRKLQKKETETETATKPATKPKRTRKKTVMISNEALEIPDEIVDNTVDYPEEVIKANDKVLELPQMETQMENEDSSSDSDSSSSEEEEEDTDSSDSDSSSSEEEEEEDEDDKKTVELYPTLDDPNFSYNIAKRKEFADTKYDGAIKGIREQANQLCNSEFELMPHQLFVRNFLSFQTPYNSLLLYHGLGSGKTCSAIGIAEEMRSYMKQMGITKRIIIVASPNVQDNFRLQLFDERKLKELPDGTWNLNTCIGNALLQEINPTNLRGLTRDRIVAQIRSLINNYYVFMGNKGEFANYIRKAISVPADAGYTPKEAAAIRERKIRAHFNNRLVVIDEIHNVRISDSNKTKLTSVLLNEVARKSDNMRLLLLSATPMYNSYNEIIWLANLLNANDKRGAIKIEDVFQSNGDWVEADGQREGGRELLTRKLTGYISYVRGENPYVFPYRIYPDTFSPDHVIGAEYPTKQMNQMEITEPLQFIPVYVNGIGAYQNAGYQYIMDYYGLKSNVVVDKQGKERAIPSFENMESFGYTLLLAPLEALIMVYPHPGLDKEVAKEEGEKKGKKSEKEKKEVIKSIIGKHGLANIMKFSRTEKPVPRRFDYEYKPKAKAAYGEVFSSDHISKYSAKIANICEIIRRPSQGIVLIYSQYIDGGLVPMALALESMGFSRWASTSDHNRSLLKHPAEPVDSLTMKKRSEIKGVFKPAKYVMITGEKDFSQNNNEDIKYVTNKENAEGANVKVILISMAASEGLDFKNIRQVHILEPWYNMNRIEQIIGRGVRNLSHCDLEFEDRNVEIYLHGTKLDRDEEAADLYVYRSAEKKAVQIGRVTRVIKENAVDCLLNIGQTNFTEAKLLADVANRDIRIRLSSGPEVEYRVGDKPRTEVCDYMADCDFKCAVRGDSAFRNGFGEEVDISVGPIIRDTYDENFVKANSVVIMKKIRDLFMEKMVYRRDHLIAAINFVKKYPPEHIYYALTRFVQNKNEGLVDKYGRSGYLISRGDYYAFQPSEIMDETISSFERSVPVDYKPVALTMKVPKEIRPWISNASLGAESEVGSAAAAASPAAPVDAASVAVVEEPANTRSYDDILKEITSIVQILTKKDLEIKAIDSNWYKHANKMVPELMVVHQMKSELVNKYVIFHYLDKLPAVDKLVLISNLYENDEGGSAEERRGVLAILTLYFDELILKVDDEGESRTAVVLANGSANKMFVQGSDNVWKPATYTDEKTFAAIRKERLNVPFDRIHRTEIGFMHPFKEKEIVFKTKDLTQKRNNKGAKCTDSSKRGISMKIGVVLGEPNIYMATQIERPELCVLLEILMRWRTESTDTVYFFGPEKANEMKLANLHW